MTARIIPFRVDEAAMIREDILTRMRDAQPEGDIDGFVAAANDLARWLVRPGGAVRRLMGHADIGVHPGQMRLLGDEPS